MKPRQAYRRASLEGPSEATRQAACRNPKWACLYAQKIDQRPRPDTRAAACADPHWALQYALYIDQGPSAETRAAAGKSAEQAYLYALKVDRRPHQATRAAASRDPRWARRYALDIDGVAPEALEPSVGARAGPEGQAAVWHFRVGGEEAGERWRALPDAEQRRVAQAFAAWSGEVERRRPRASLSLLLAACAFGLRPEWRQGKRRDQDYDYLVFLEGSSRRVKWKIAPYPSKRTGRLTGWAIYHRNTRMPRGHHAQRRYLRGKAKNVDSLVEYILSHEEYERGGEERVEQPLNPTSRSFSVPLSRQHFSSHSKKCPACFLASCPHQTALRLRSTRSSGTISPSVPQS